MKNKETISESKGINLQNDKVKEIEVFDTGGSEYPPVILLKLEENKTVKYLYNDYGVLKDSLTIVNNPQYSNLFREVPQEFVNSNGTDFSSPNDDNGLFFIIKLDNGVEHQWGVFLGNFQYSKAIEDYTNKVINSINEK